MTLNFRTDFLCNLKYTRIGNDQCIRFNLF